MRKTVVFGMVGSSLDGGRGEGRWERWRPTVAICSQEHFVVDRLELLCSPRERGLAEQIRADLALVSPETEVRLTELAFADPWDLEEVYGALHDLARAYAFDVEREDYLLHVTTGTHIFQICLFLLAESRHFPARLLQAAPPNRRQGEGLGPGSVTVIDLDLSRYDKLARRFAREQTEGLAFLKAGIDTRDAGFNALIERIERVALASRDPILLTGATGVGKSRLARRIYELKRQRRQVGGAFVEVNCATLRGDAAMSTLFGHRRGAFTGAQSERAGLLVAADGGLLFLDEIGELGLDEQAMLLHALEQGRFRPLGGDAEVSSSFQLLAGTNRDLGEAVRLGRFREDLLARIDLWSFRLPGLTERRADVEPNLRYELAEQERRSGTKLGLSAEARKRYLDFATSARALWRGNFRDLAASVTRLATLAEGGRISLAGVEEEIVRLEAAWQREHGGAAADPLAELLSAEALAELDRFDRVQLADVVRVCRASRSLAEAGRELFAASRARKKQPNDADRLRKYLARFGLDFARLRGGGAHFLRV
jgi:transcriptional regulatory protein RtcR